MASFSERYGYKAPRSVVQRDDLDEDTRMDTWNVLHAFRRLDQMRFHADEHENFCVGIWTGHFRFAGDAYTGTTHLWSEVKGVVLRGPWNEVFDLLEAVVRAAGRSFGGSMSNVDSAITSAMNGVFEKDLVGYRFLDKKIAPVSSEFEAKAISDALDAVGQLDGARHSLKRAVELLSDRQSPDYPNSIKESISSVEAVVATVTGAGSLGAGLSRLEQAGVSVHPALRAAWSKMYGWTSDANGIRHAGVEAADADQAIARYMLVTCSAFVSYVVEAGRKASLLR